VNHLPWLAACVLAGGALDAPAQQALHPPSAASAPLPPASHGVTLAAAVDAAWQRAVAARDALGQRQRADAQRSVAAAHWAAPPALQFNHRDDRWQRNAGRRETEIALAWPLWLPGQRAAQGAAAQAGVEQAELAQDAARLRIAGEVREAAWTLIARRAEFEQANAQAQSLQTLADDVDRRVRAGDLAQADALAARAEWLHATAQLNEARQQLLAARGHWAVLTGLDAGPSADESVDPSPAAADSGVSAHPELRLAAQATEHARRRVEWVSVSRREPPELTVGVRHDVPGRAEPSQNSVAIGLRLPFGTDDRNQPLQAAALSELDAAQTGEQRLRDRLQAGASIAQAARQSAEQTLADERSRAALLHERARLIDRSFRAGESPLPELLRALASAAQADAAVARQQAALGLARARLHQALGILP
jgi:outer membrane protein, heavy metal efflux system